MRTLDEIYNSILERKKIYTDLDGLTSTSKTAILRNILWVCSFLIWTHEQIFESHKKETAKMIEEDKAHTPRWYRKISLAFQYGFSLLLDSDKFNNSGFPDEQIENSKIIKYCAVEE